MEGATMAASTEVLASLNGDLALEHGAILQYVIHGTQLRDVAVTDLVKRVAREEMWHFEWLAEAIRDRGGEPALDRADVFTSLSLAESMRADVETEGRALAHYERTLEVIGDSDEDLTRLIERIMSDERAHRTTFERLGAQAVSAGEESWAPAPRTGPQDLPVAGATIGNEYATVLQYLMNKYGCGDCDQAEDYFDLAVDEMRHMSWAASYVVGLAPPQPPPVPSDRVRFVHGTAEARELAELLETSAAEFYAVKIEEASSDSLRGELSRASEQHDYHRYRVSRLG
jgi:bacterioferritin